jgi:hypothetical protein
VRGHFLLNAFNHYALVEPIEINRADGGGFNPSAKLGFRPPS